MTFLFLLLLFFNISDDAPKSTLTGVWEGILIQDYKPPRIYKFKMILQQKGNNITGKSEIIHQDSKYFGVMALTGTFNKNKFAFKETSVIDQLRGENWSWCLKKGALLFNPAKDSLTGKWDGCEIPGTIKLHRIKTK